MGALSPQMSFTLGRAREAGALVRHPGGYWAEPDAVIRDNGVPEGWWTGTRTVMALVDRGLLGVTMNNGSGACRVRPAEQR